MSRNRFTPLAGALMLTAAMAPGAMAQAPQSEVRHDMRPGDRVERNGAAVHVGPRGTWTSINVSRLEGEHTTLTALTRADGSVVITSDDGKPRGSDQMTESTAAAPGPSSPAACSDDAYNLSKFSFSDGTQKAGKWKSRFDWHFKANSVPSGVNVDEARTKFSAATANITNSRNDCGLADQVGATHSRVGDTTAGTDFTSGGEGCQGYGAIDNKSVAGWGTLPSSALGSECSWGTWNGTDTYVTMTQSDVRLNPSYKWYTTTPPVTCTNATGTLDTRYFSVEGVMTHERGHTFGVGHVSESSHGHLTMSTANNGACQDSESTLGWGDVRALRTLY